MSGEKKYSEREMVMAKRAAFVAGNQWVWKSGATDEAEQRYPLPKVVRPRVVKVSGVNSPWVAYRLHGSSIQAQECLDACCPHDIRWEDVESVPTHHIRALADLLANPTETVEDDV
jgi:hypothetical protein